MRTLPYRYYRICSSQSILENCLKELKAFLSNNGYPPGILNFHVADVLKRQKNEKVEISLAPKAQLTIYLPYLGPDSINIQKSLRACFESATNCINMRTVFSNTSRIASFFPFKDRVKTVNRSKVVYQARCSTCSSIYIGKTKKRLNNCTTEHFKALTQPHNYKSSIADHLRATGHEFDWDGFSILAYGRSDLHTKIKETLFIQELKPGLNGNEGSEKL